MDVESQLLGPLSVPAEAVYTFENGIFGSPDTTRFALIPSGVDGFFWLQSLDLASLAFLLIDPFRFVDDYSIELDSGGLDGPPLGTESQVLVLTTLTLSKDGEGNTTTNLEAPIVLSVTEQRGKQLAIESPWGIRHPIDVAERAERPKT